MAKRAGLWRAMIFLSALAFAACGPSLSIVEVDVTGLTDEVARLDLSATLDSRQLTTQLAPIRQNYSHFRLRIDAGERGLLSIQITARDPDGCDVSVGAQSVQIDGSESYSTTVMLTPQPGCLLELHKLGEGAGQVSLSDGTVWSFDQLGRPEDEDPCKIKGTIEDIKQAKLPFGTQLQLTGSVPLEYARQSYFAGWAGDCQGGAVCSIQINAHQSMVQAGFLPSQICSIAHFCWENPRPQGTSLRRVLGRAANDVWAVGDRGTVLHYNGSYWASPRRVVTTDAINGLWIGDAVNLSLVTDTGAIQRYNDDYWTCPSQQSETPLYDVWGASRDNMWAVGAGGTLLHFDGTRWTLVPTPSGTGTLRAVRGTSANDVWAVGSQATVLHYDGASWNKIDLPSSLSGRMLNDIWPSATNVVWIVGELGTAINIDGGIISLVPSEKPSKLLGVWGSGATDIWAVGEDGDILHYDGRWSAVDSGTILHLRSVWGTGVSDVWTVGDNGTMLHFNGSVWLPVSVTHGNSSILGIWGPSGATPMGTGNGLFAIGQAGLALLWSGADWVSATGLDGESTHDLHAAWGQDMTDLWIVGDMGEILHLKSGMRAAHEPSGTLESLNGVWGSSKTNVLAVGDHGRLLRYDGNQFRETILPAAGGNALYGIWGSSASDVWIVGDFGTLLHFDGSTASAATASPLTVRALNAVWGSAANDVWAVGDGGVILHYDGTAWSANKNSGQFGASNLLAIYGTSASSIIATGDAGTILYYNGTDWSPQDSGAAVSFKAVWGSELEGFVIAGQGADILRYRQPATH